jgi:TetR/AcrR family transcriptional repressor of nem operon
MSTAPQRTIAPTSTASRMLDAAERLVQTMGFNWFSYADISEELGIRKASLHHHFSSKEALGRALIQRYTTQFDDALREISASDSDAAGKLEKYVALYSGVLRAERICLCGMLAAEFSSLPESMQTGIRAFFDLNEKWLAHVVSEGRRSGIFHDKGSARDTARMLLSSLEGAMLVARPYKDANRFTAAAEQILRSVRAPMKRGRG